MIGFFPIPYPDEILYSVFARYHARSKNKSLSSTVNSLFGHDASRIVVDLPNKLDYLVNQLPPGSKITVERLIDEHTLFPFYVPFLPVERVDQLRKSMAEKSSGGSIHGRLGILTSNIEVEFLRFCPSCAKEDISLYGQPYWHRAHQLPGIFVCQKHSVFLENSAVKCSYHGRKDALFTALDAIHYVEPKPLNLNNRDHVAHLTLAKEATWLLQQKLYDDCGPNFFRVRFLQVLMRSGMASINGQADMNIIHERFSDFYSAELLSSLSSPLDNKHTWLRRLIQSSVHFQHPIRNLLLLNFLECSLEDFLKLPETIYPVGKAPFPCLNPASKHYKELRINDIKFGKSASSQKIAATFYCDCDFVYRRFGWDEEGQRKYEFDYVISYGEIFSNKLLYLKKKGMAPDAIAKFLSLSIGIIQSQLKKLRASQITKREKMRSKSNLIEELRRSYRADWIQRQKQNPDLGRYGLSMVNRRCYEWLRKYDGEWFEKNSPERMVIKEKANRINWAERDVELAAKADVLANEFLTSPDYPVRVTITGIAKRLKFAYLVVKRPDCIPKTIEILKKNAESTEDFIARRILYATDCLISEKVPAQLWMVLNRAKVSRPSLIKLPKVQIALAKSKEKLETAYYSGSRVTSP